MIELAGPDWDERLHKFVQMKAGVGAPTGPTQVLGFVDGDSICGAWMFERYTGRGGSVVAHWASSDRGWLTPSYLRLVAIYIFDQMGVGKVWGEVRASDKYVRRVDEKLGFKQEAMLAGYFPDDDLALYSLTKQDCRWLPADFKETPDG